MAFRAIEAPVPLVKDQTDLTVKRILQAQRDTQRGMADYPQQLPTSSGYTRTGTLGRGWKTRTVRGNNLLRAIIENSVGYAGFVQGDEQTGEMASRNWQTLAGVVDPIYASMLTDINRIMSRSQS